MGGALRKWRRNRVSIVVTKSLIYAIFLIEFLLTQMCVYKIDNCHMRECRMPACHTDKLLNSAICGLYAYEENQGDRVWIYPIFLHCSNKHVQDMFKNLYFYICSIYP